MKGPVTQGWYRRPRDEGHIVHRVSGRQGAWLTCMFDLRTGYPCSNGALLTEDAWERFERASAAPPVPN